MTSNPRLFEFSEKQFASFSVCEDLELCIERVISCAYLYCKDQDIDKLITVFKIDVDKYDGKKSKVLVEPHILGGSTEYYLHKSHNFCLLSSSFEYEVRYKNETVLMITPHPCWKLTPFLQVDEKKTV
jgi:hypothetical protein